MGLPTDPLLQSYSMLNDEWQADPASRKAVVVKAVVYGLISEKEALERYALSEEEFALWRSAVAKHGEDGLKVTAIQKYRQL